MKIKIFFSADNQLRTVFWVFIFYISVSICFFFIPSGKIIAGEADTMSGWLWASNTGWISLNSSNCANLNLEDLGTCNAGGVDYGVTINEEDGSVSGEAWSENFGWICFGSTCDEWNAGNEPESGNGATASFDGVKFSGWANIYSMGTAGWIKLQGPAVSSEGKSGASCFDCFYNEDEEPECKSCFTEISPLEDNYGLTGDVCYNCAGCAIGSEPVECSNCDLCNRYGLVVDSVEKQIYGWAWGGNNGQGAGWIKAYENNSLYMPFSWLQTKYGNIYSEESILGRSAPPGRYNATYCIQASGLITDFKSETGCEMAGSEEILFPDQGNSYTNILGKIDRQGIIDGKYAEVVTIEQQNKTQYKRADLTSRLKNGCELDGKIYHIKGDLIINNSGLEFCNGEDGAGLIVVDGDLYVEKDISYESEDVSRIKNLASAGWIIKGNLYISPEVGQVVGAFYAEGNDGVDDNPAVDTVYEETPEGETDNVLIIYGLLAAPKYNFGRTYSSINEGSEQIIYDGRALINTPPGMRDLTKALPLWSEAAP